MLKNRTLSCMAVGLLVLLAGTFAFGQGLAGMQLFAPADVSSYGRGPQPNEGFFFDYDILYWTISPPRVTTIGKPGLTRNVYIGPDLIQDRITQHNELDTGDLRAEFTLGNRIEVGRVTENHGWMVSVFQMQDMSQSVPAHDVAVCFDEASFGPGNHHALEGQFTNPNPLLPNLFLELPLTFTNVLLRNDISTWGIELDYVGRSEQFHDGGFFEWYIGPRYIEFDDTFLVNTQGGILDASNWVTEAQNHIIAGQVGARLFKKQGRWMISSEGRFLAGLNCQNIHQTGELGTNMTPGTIDSGQPFFMGPTGIYHNAFIHEFTPGLEVRLDARYQITRSVSFRIGWTGLWLDRIARASSMINYTLDPEHTSMGILRDQNRQNVLLNGLTVGIDINR